MTSLGAELPDNLHEILYFNLTSYTETGLELQITFAHPEWISTNTLFMDEFVLKFKDVRVFVDNIDYLPITRKVLVEELPQ